MPSKIKIEIRAELRDAQGKIIKTLPWVRSNSLLKQFIQLLVIVFNGVTGTIKDITGADRNTNSNIFNLQMFGTAGQTDRNILIGTGTTAVAMTDYKLETQVTTNITHAAASFAVENPDASTWRVSIARVFTNNTGASLGIKEVALYCLGSSTPYYFCIDRTLYSVDVPNGVAVTLTYRITVSL